MSAQQGVGGSDRSSIANRAGLQAERTDLSWVRTGLAVLANGGLLMLRQDTTHPSTLQLIAGSVALVLALLTLAIGWRRKRALGARPLPNALAASIEVTLLAAGAVLLVGASLVALLC